MRSAHLYRAICRYTGLMAGRSASRRSNARLLLTHYRPAGSACSPPAVSYARLGSFPVAGPALRVRRATAAHGRPGAWRTKDGNESNTQYCFFTKKN